MKREILATADGSHTIQVNELNVSYHSKHGAIQESTHVYINAALKYIHENNSTHAYSILEMGFGTGLNALLTARYAAENDITIHYHSIEAFPLADEQIALLNYGNILGLTGIFSQLHQAPWNKQVTIGTNFSLQKYHTTIQFFHTGRRFNAVYYDAFAPSAQPELWTTEIFRQIFNLLRPGGILVTYCSKTVVRKAMEAAGFRVTKIQGPFGKREMVRAFRDH